MVSSKDSSLKICSQETAYHMQIFSEHRNLMPSLPMDFQHLTFGSSDHTNVTVLCQEKEDCPST